MNSVSLDELCVNAVRVLAMDAVQAADSGHPGAPMALAPLGYVLWTRHLRHDPSDPHWPNRDRFVLSCGHASMLLYGLLHLTGYDLSLEDLKKFRQFGSKTPGHPEFGVAPGVETTTGPLGQGFGNAVGMAIAEAHLAAMFNRDGHRIVDHFTYVLASDGDLMEGISHEAASVAGHLKLGKLIAFYDDNRITIDGSTSLTCSDDTGLRFEAYGWHVQHVLDGNDLEALDRAIAAAREESDRPSLIVVRTHIAYGSPNKQDSASAHGAALGEDEVELTKKNLGWPSLEPFHLPEEALAECRKCVGRGEEWSSAWRECVKEYGSAYPREAEELNRRLAGELPAGWEGRLPAFDAGSLVATRGASGKALNALASSLPELVGGSADLAGSVKTVVTAGGNFGPGEYTGRNVHFGIREHAMGAVMNGMALHGGFRPFGGTFLIFADYMRPAIRLAAMMRQPIIYLFSHDSIGLGEDGPTHQPVESIATLRAIPGLTVIRPADANDVVEAWRTVVKHRQGPVALVLSRQKLPVFDREGRGAPTGVAQGAYVLSEAADGKAPHVILMGSGSEVAVLLAVQEELEGEGIAARVVNVASLELFAAQTQEYRNTVLPPHGPVRVAVEAAHPMPWYRWVGDSGDVIGIERFGRSAPYEELFEYFGFTPESIVERVKSLLDR
jgi:transketolase